MSLRIVSLAFSITTSHKPHHTKRKQDLHGSQRVRHAAPRKPRYAHIQSKSAAMPKRWASGFLGLLPSRKAQRLDGNAGPVARQVWPARSGHSCDYRPEHAYIRVQPRVVGGRFPSSDTLASGPSSFCSSLTAFPSPTLKSPIGSLWPTSPPRGPAWTC
jgi:hypothetical protein